MHDIFGRQKIHTFIYKFNCIFNRWFKHYKRKNNNNNPLKAVNCLMFNDDENDIIIKLSTEWQQKLN